MSKVKGPFAVIRVELIEHMWCMTPMECKVYLTMHLMARRNGEDRGKVFTNVRTLARINEHKWEIVKKAIDGLEEKDYLKRIDKGWWIINFNGDNPGNTPKKLSRKWIYELIGITQKSDNHYPKTGEVIIQKLDNELSKKRITTTHKVKKIKSDKATLEDIEARRGIEDKGLPSAWPDWYVDITWNKKELKVEMTDRARHSLSEHLREVAAQENISPLTLKEAQYAWGVLNGHLIGNRYKTGPKTLPPLVVNWFENDLRRSGRVRCSPRKNRAEDPFEELRRKIEDEEGNGQRITE